MAKGTDPNNRKPASVLGTIVGYLMGIVVLALLIGFIVADRLGPIYLHEALRASTQNSPVLYWVGVVGIGVVTIVGLLFWFWFSTSPTLRKPKDEKNTPNKS